MSSSSSSSRSSLATAAGLACLTAVNAAPAVHRPILSSSLRNSIIISQEDLPIPDHRDLQLEKFIPFGNIYVPDNDVTSYSNIDLDVRAILARTNLGTDDGFLDAAKIYAKGAFALSFAQLEVSTSALQAVPQDTIVDTVGGGTHIPSGTLITGLNSDGNDSASGILLQDVELVGQTVYLVVQYITPNCYVGGLADSSPVTDQCFAESTGDKMIGIGGGIGNIHYQYEALKQTFNDLSLESMVLDGAGLEASALTPYLEFAGSTVYPNLMMEAALKGSKTRLPQPAIGDFDFSELNLEGRTAAILNGVIGLNIFSYVIKKMGLASEVCGSGLDNAKQNAIYHWDQMVALYVGSTARREDSMEGYLLYSLANDECRYYGTCDGPKEAKVNKQILELFAKGKDQITNNQCNLLETDTIPRVHSLIVVPFIQSLLRQAYALDNQGDTQMKTQGKAAGLAASMLPALFACDLSAATVIYNDFQPGEATKANYGVIKFNLERTYQCLGITCNDVGGLLDPDMTTGNMYLAGAEPCGGSGSSSGGSGSGNSSGGGGSFNSSPWSPFDSSYDANAKDGKTIGIAIGVTMIALVLIMVIVKYLCCGRHKVVTKQPSAATDSSDADVDAAANIVEQLENNPAAAPAIMESGENLKVESGHMS